MATIQKPALDLVSEAMRFAAEGQAEPPAPPEPIKTEKTGQSANRVKKTAKTASKSGLVPEDDVRLTANINIDLHTRLKMAAAKQRTTIGELIELLIKKHL